MLSMEFILNNNVTEIYAKSRKLGKYWNVKFKKVHQMYVQKGHDQAKIMI